MDESGNDLLQHTLHQKHQNHPLNGFHVTTNGPYRNFPPSPPQLDPNAAAAAGKRSGFPPTSPYSHFPSPAANRPPPFFNLDPLSAAAGAPSPTASFSDDVAMDDVGAGAGASKNGLPPRKSHHRRSQSDIPFVFQSSPVPASSGNWLPFLGAAGKSAPQGVKTEGDNGDDFFNAFMNLEGLEALNSSEENREDLNSRDSGSKTNGGGADSSENEADSNGNNEGRVGLWGGEEGAKRSKAVGPAMGPRHSRSLSMDSFMGKLNFGEEQGKLMPGPGFLSGGQTAKNDGGPNCFSLEFGNGEFTAAELKKIMANEKLVELAMVDPKRVKRILANRQSAARSKERKMRYIAELEHKVQALQSEATTLLTQLNLLQRDSAGLATQNNELKFRIQAMEQQAQLRDALNEALTGEVQRLKLAAAGLVDAHASNQQTSVTSQFQMHQKQQSSHMSLYQLQKQDEDGEERRSEQ